MAIAVTGSIANDYLMTFPGRFAELIVEEQLDRLSLSFLVDELEIRRGGVAANICFGMAQLGVPAVLVGAVGDDFEPYRAWLDDHGVDTRWVHVSELRHTARFHCTTDADQNQIASFYAGAMREAREITLHPIAAEVGGFEFVVVSPNDPQAMVRHTAEARQHGFDVVADPSQQLARMEGDDIRRLVEGARLLVTNDYERALLESKTGWSHREVLARVDVAITTHGAKGCVVESGDDVIEVPAVAPTRLRDPTGVGDGFRAGVLASLSWGLGLERAAQVGCLVATHVLETVGTQEYVVAPDRFVERFARDYGAAAADEVAAHLPATPGGGEARLRADEG